jgi:ADP-heptose:LPS heptosyltransferase
VRESRLKNVGKKIELAVRRAFISFLQFQSRFRKKGNLPTLPLQLPENPTILFLRQDKLGDAIISTPLLSAMFKKFPAAHFIMLLGEKNKGIAELLPIPCEIITYKKSFFSDIVMLRKLRRRKIDVLIDLMDNPSSTSSIIAPAISAAYSVGIEKENAVSYTILVPLLDRSSNHITRRLLELARPFGIDPESIPLRAVLKKLPVTKIEGRAGLVISAGVIERQLLPDVNAEIASEIIVRGYASQVMIFYDPKDRSLAESIVRSANSPRVMLAPLTKEFPEYAAILCTCELVITPDTSAVHLCSAYNIPVVVMTNPFPPTLHYWTPIDVPYELIHKESVRSLKAKTVIEHLENLLKKIKPDILETAIAE